jgi:hypothetical protein
MECDKESFSRTGYGGCIYNEYGEVHTENCTFTNCTAKNGAGIYNAGDTE